MIKTYFLMPLIKSYPTKTFTKEDGEWKKVKDYPLMKHFRGIVQEVKDLKHFSEILKLVSKKKVFMIHGKFKENIETEKMIRRSRKDHSDGLPATIEDNLETFLRRKQGLELVVSTSTFGSMQELFKFYYYVF